MNRCGCVKIKLYLQKQMDSSQNVVCLGCVKIKLCLQKQVNKSQDVVCLQSVEAQVLQLEDFSNRFLIFSTSFFLLTPFQIFPACIFDFLVSSFFLSPSVSPHFSLPLSLSFFTISMYFLLFIDFWQNSLNSLLNSQIQLSALLNLFFTALMALANFHDCIFHWGTIFLNFLFPLKEEKSYEKYSNQRVFSPSCGFISQEYYCFQFSSVQFNHSVVSNSLRPHELQQARPLCPSPTPYFSE